MNGIVLTITGAITLLIAALMFIMPTLMRPTLPLGVSIPHGRIGDPAVHRAIQRFRCGVAAAFIVSLAACLATSGGSPNLALLLPVPLMVVLGTVSYVLARRGILRAKREHDWYRGVPVRLTASVSAHDTVDTPVPATWFVASLLLLVAVAGFGISIYGALPDPMPIHWNAAGVVDGYAAKSAWSVFGAVCISIGVIVMLFAIAFWIRSAPMRRVGGDTPAQAQRRRHGQQHLTLELLGQTAALVAIVTACAVLQGWLAPHASHWSGAIGILTPALIVAVIAAFVVRWMRLNRSLSRPPAGSTNTPSADTPTPHPDTPDDDSHWKAGIIYINRDDPSILVPKRFGIGWTLNFGHPTGVLITLGILALVALLLISATIQPGS